LLLLLVVVSLLFVAAFVVKNAQRQLKQHAKAMAAQKVHCRPFTAKCWMKSGYPTLRWFPLFC